MKTKTTIYMALFLALLICTVNVSATWWNNDWQYKKEITLTEQSVSDLTNYQVKIELNTTPLYDAGKLQSQCQDIRFINGSENAELDFWIEECITNNNSKNSIFWVEVPSITASSTETIYVYYGNSGASSKSNGTNTFIFFDDFLGTSLDTARWDEVNSPNSITVSGSIIDIYESAGWAGISSDNTFGAYDIATRARMKYDHNTQQGLGDTQEFTTDALSFRSRSAGSSVRTWNNGEYTLTGIPYEASNYHIDEGLWKSGEVKFYQDGSHQATHTTNIPDTAINYRLSAQSGAHIYSDWVLIRKYTPPEPTYNIGSEEQENQPPNNPNPSITPSIVYTNTDIVCTATYIDSDGDSGTLNFTILVDGTSEKTCYYSLNNNTQKTCNLSSGNYTKTQVINCSVTATDNNSKSATSSTTETVQNSPPTTPTSLTPTSGTYTTSVLINCSGSTDADNDTIYYDIQSNISGFWGNVTTNDSDGYYAWTTSSYTQDNVALRCRATDLTDNSGYYNSTGTINIDNTAPSINLNATLSNYNTILDRVWAYIEFYSDSTLNACLLDWNGTNESINVSVPICYKNKTSLSIGNYTFRGWANDSVGNWNYTDEYWIYINATTTTTTTTTSTTLARRSGGGGWGGGTPNVATVIKVPTCDDGIQNQGEEGIDCGGPCSPCKAPTTTIKAITTTTTLKATTTTIKKATTTTTTTRAPTTTIRTTTTTMSTGGGVALATTGIVILAFILFAGIIVYLMRMK